MRILMMMSSERIDIARLYETDWLSRYRSPKLMLPSRVPQMIPDDMEFKNEGEPRYVSTTEDDDVRT